MSDKRRYELELNEMIGKLYLMMRQIEEKFVLTMTALSKKDKKIAEELYNGEADINALEREIEQICLRILLMAQPVAGDFRKVSSALKMITDLERIGDQIKDVCKMIMRSNLDEYIFKATQIAEMGKIAVGMVKDSVGAYINRDLDLARSLDESDDKVDAMFKQIKAELVDVVRSDPDKAEQVMFYLMIAKYIEKIADHAVNIGEWAEYSITAEHKGTRI